MDDDFIVPIATVPTCQLHGEMRLESVTDGAALWECEVCGTVDEMAVFDINDLTSPAR